MLLKAAVQLALVLIVSVVSYAGHSEPWKSEFSMEYKAYQSAMQADPEAVLQQMLASPPPTSSSAVQQGQYHYFLCEAYYTLSFPHKALEQSKLALALVEYEQQPWLFHKIRLAESMVLEVIGKPREGLPAVNAALVWAERQNDQNLLTSGLLARGGLLNSLADYVGALRDLLRAYKLSTELDIETAPGEVAGLLGLVYEYRSEYELAIPYFAEEVAHQRQMQNWIALSIALYGLGNNNKRIGNLELARSQLTESLTVAEQVNDTQGVAYALMSLGNLDITQGDYLAAEGKLLQAEDIFSQAEHWKMQLNVASELLYLARLQKKTTLAVKYLQMANKLIDPISMPFKQLSLDEEQAHVFALQGDFRQAYEKLADTTVARKEMNRQKSTEEFHQLRSKYEVEVKEQQNKLLEQENKLQKSRLMIQGNRNVQLMTLVALSALLCLLLVVVFYRSKKRRARLEKLANTDGLTGLMNRRKTIEMLTLQLELATSHKLPLSVAMVDMDNFKQVNDKYGHAAGDKVLIEFSRLCRATFRQTDIVGRIGGEEFLIVLPHTDINAAKITLDGLRIGTQNLSTLINIDGLSTSISCGLCQHLGQMTVEDILSDADRALYDAKDQGRNTVSMASMPNENEIVVP